MGVIHVCSAELLACDDPRTSWSFKTVILSSTTPGWCMWAKSRLTYASKINAGFMRSLHHSMLIRTLHLFTHQTNVLIVPSHTREKFPSDEGSVTLVNHRPWTLVFGLFLWIMTSPCFGDSVLTFVGKQPNQCVFIFNQIKKRRRR